MTDDIYREIGHGHCGSVWFNEADDPSLAIKREDGGPGRSIGKDGEMHQRVQNSLTKIKVHHLNIPTYNRLIPADDDFFWDQRLVKFPHDKSHRYIACNALVSERIRPFARAEREKLIDLFCRESSRKAIKGSKSDEDCLVRPYLGRRTRTKTTSPFFTLRNRPLKLDQMIDLNLPIEDYARTMADALAVVYWHAQVDANDIEFVLAPVGTHPDSAVWSSDIVGEHTMWVLDFDCCDIMTQDEEGIEKAARGFYRNDPYFPRPAAEGDDVGRQLWGVFISRFLEKSREVLGGESELPQMMARRLEQLGYERIEEVRSRCSD